MGQYKPTPFSDKYGILINHGRWLNVIPEDIDYGFPIDYYEYLDSVSVEMFAELSESLPFRRLGSAFPIHEILIDNEK
jgi:hypothetical protein